MIRLDKLCEQYRTNGVIAEWISEKDVPAITEITKQDVFVLENFAGSIFNKLSSTKALIVGPRCLSCCLTEGTEIPRGPHPVFTIAMRDLVVIISHLDSENKKQLATKITWMGGRYESVLTEETTHLIAGNVLSEKYIKASYRGIKIMKPEWVQAAWEAALDKNVSASSPQFNDYLVPIFHGLVASSSGIGKHKKKELTKLITENGGKLIGEFISTEVNLLILDSNSIGSAKYNAAQEYGVPCIFPEYIYESIKKGFALNYKDFTVSKAITSSPNRASQLPNMSLNFSTITNLRSSDGNETSSTICSDRTESTIEGSAKTQRNRSRLCGIAKELAQLVDAIEMKDVKQAGLFLDGCCIYIYGLTASRHDKLQRVVSRAGAVRYSQPVEAVTHAICGDPSLAKVQSNQSSMPRAIHVTIRWFTDSLHARKALDETPYLVFPVDKQDTTKKSGASVASPMSKRNVQLLRTPSRLPPVPLFSLDKEEDRDDIVQQYMDQSKLSLQESEDTLAALLKPDEEKSSNTIRNLDENLDPTDDNTLTLAKDKTKDETKPTTPSMNRSNMQKSTVTNQSLNITSQDDIQEQIFEGLTFELHDMDEQAEPISDSILSAGGVIVPPGKGGSYIVVPINCDDVKITNKQAEIVTNLWLYDCLSKEEVLETKYYHKPLKIDCNSKPLTGLVFAISSYVGTEREFLAEVSVLLGANVQNSLCRRNTASASRSTHLICPEPTGAKYNGAVNWGITIVNNQWILDCAVANRRVNEGPYLIGDSKVPESDCVDESNENAKSSICNKENTLCENQKSPAINNKDNEGNKKSPDVNNALLKNNDSISKQRSKMSFAENTPVNAQRKSSLGGSSEMSPASRYIAMARQGLLGPESQESPKMASIAMPDSHANETMSTPPMDNALATPNLALFSPTSRRRLQAIKRGERPSNPPRTPRNPFDISACTPESPFGAILRTETGPVSPESRKRLWKFCEDLPVVEKKQSQKEMTPIDDLRRGYFNKIYNSNVRKLDMNDEETPPRKQMKLSEVQATSTKISPDPDIEVQLKQLNSVLTGGSNDSSTPRSLKLKRNFGTSSPANSTVPSKELPESVDAEVRLTSLESQVDNVGWDDMSEPINSLKENNSMKVLEQPKRYIFMMSQNVENAEEIKKIIERLGGSVIDSKDVDISATHLLASRLGRSEKNMGFLASGKWILHPSFIVRSQEAGRFVDEENFEWGNPKAPNLVTTPSEKNFAAAVYRWRSRRSQSFPLPFSSMRVIMHMEETRKKPLLRVLAAGGGEVVDISPPFTDQSEIDATHCFVEQRRMPLSHADLSYLASRRIPVCPPVLLNNILVDDPPPDAMEFAYPEYKKLL